MLCNICGEEANYWQHDELAHTFGRSDVEEDCNYDADWQGEETGYVGSCDHHEFEAGCSCEESGRCVVCIEQAVDYADHMRDAAKEG